MSDRKYNPKSLENLKLGGASRRSGKERHAYSILPTTHSWLASGGNASQRLDEVVGKILAGELVGVAMLRKLEAEIADLKKQLADKSHS